MSERSTIVCRDRRTATTVWLALVVLSAVVAGLDRLGVQGAAFTAVLLVTAFVKGQLIADHFMGLRRVQARWRAILFAYLLVVVAGIGIAYWISL